MKKYLFVVGCALLLFVVTGCGKNQVKCTGSYEEGGMKMDAEIIAEFDKDDKLTDADITFDLKEKETADQLCALFKLVSDEEKGISVNCSGTKVTIKGYAKIEDSEAEEEDKLAGKTKADFIKAMEEEGFTCK